MNVWGQTEAVEGRELMMTGLFGPQTDLNRLPNWGRGHQTGGEDPFLSGSLVGAADQRHPGARASCPR